MRSLIAFLAAAAIAGAATAQTASTPPRPKPAAVKSTSAAPTTSSRKARTPQSLDCSKQADTKGLHGADRKKFRASCMKAAA